MPEIVMQLTADNRKHVFRAMFDRSANLDRAMELVLRERVRSQDQNRKLWPMLADVAKQVPLCINGQMVVASPEDWKDVYTASLRREQRMAQGIDGGLVFLGNRTSKMRKAEFSQLIELIYAHGSENGVQWSEPAISAYEQYREAQ